MSAERAFFRPDAPSLAQPLAPNINGEEFSRECYTPADAWLARMAQKHRPPMPHSQLPLHSEAAPPSQYKPLQLSLVPMPPPLPDYTPASARELDKADAYPPLCLAEYSAPSAPRESVPDSRELERMIDDCLVRVQVTRIAMELFATLALWGTIRPRVTLLLRELRMLDRKVAAMTKTAREPEGQLTLLQGALLCSLALS